MEEEGNGGIHFPSPPNPSTYILLTKQWIYDPSLSL
ncbi:hypothetical protein KSS87_011006, partial [Heliosperma pusillum]